MEKRECKTIEEVIAAVKAKEDFTLAPDVC
jgi:hypothetical protein